MEDQKKISLLGALTLLLGALLLYFTLSDVPNVEEEMGPAWVNDAYETSAQTSETASSEPDTFTTQEVTLTVWPDKASFDSASRSFRARDLDSQKTWEIYTDNATKFYRLVQQAPRPEDYFDFTAFQTLLTTWEGPTSRFTVKGETQKDGSLLASEIFYQIQ